jgi:hypothetical protein
MLSTPPPPPAQSLAPAPTATAASLPAPTLPPLPQGLIMLTTPHAGDEDEDAHGSAEKAAELTRPLPTRLPTDAPPPPPPPRLSPRKFTPIGPVAVTPAPAAGGQCGAPGVRNDIGCSCSDATHVGTTSPPSSPPSPPRALFLAGADGGEKREDTIAPTLGSGTGDAGEEPPAPLAPTVTTAAAATAGVDRVDTHVRAVVLVALSHPRDRPPIAVAAASASRSASTLASVPTPAESRSRVANLCSRHERGNSTGPPPESSSPCVSRCWMRLAELDVGLRVLGFRVKGFRVKGLGFRT